MKHASSKTVLLSALVCLSGLSEIAHADLRCNDLFAGAKPTRFAKHRSEVEEFKFDMPGVKVGVVTDPTLSTGTTLFLLPPHSTANYDARGGSVAAIETTLLDESSYSNEIDGIQFSGGSTMGLEATQGARRRIYDSRGDGEMFDAIASVPGAVVYDYGNRPEKGQNQKVFPNMILGAAAYDNAKEGSMLIGRAGAGTSTTANKISGEPVWGGQGAAFKEVHFDDGFSMKIMTVVVVNAHGNIHLPDGTVLDEAALAGLRAQQANMKNRHGKNTTLSLVITDVSLDRSQLKRLANMVHTSMARTIYPFHSYTDGDICFAVSTHQKVMPHVSEDVDYAREEHLQVTASNLMQKAIIKAVAVANGVK